LSPPILVGGRCGSARVTVIAPAARCWEVDVITGYPFNYVGPAPRRFIVHAERMVNVIESSYETATREGNTR
jgi:hypothetical protein